MERVREKMRITTIGHWGAFPAQGEATSGYLLQTDEANILLDCGSGVLSLLQHHLPLEELDALVLSHYHADHIADLFCLQYAVMILHQLGKRNKPLHIYAHADNPEMFAKLAYKSYCTVHSIAAGGTCQIKDVHFSFGQTAHAVPCLTMRIESNGRTFVYTADTAWCDDLVLLADKADMLLAESSLYNWQYGKVPGHLTAGEAGLLAQKAAVKKLLLTHLPHYGNHSQLVEEAGEHYTGPISITYCGDQHDL